MSYWYWIRRVFGFQVCKTGLDGIRTQKIWVRTPLQEPHRSHVIFLKVAPGTTFTSWSKHHFVVIGKTEQQVRKTSHCDSKQQQRSHVALILFLFVRATYIWVFLRWATSQTSILVPSPRKPYTRYSVPVLSLQTTINKRTHLAACSSRKSKHKFNCKNQTSERWSGSEQFCSFPHCKRKYVTDPLWFPQLD